MSGHVWLDWGWVLCVRSGLGLGAMCQVTSGWTGAGCCVSGLDWGWVQVTSDWTGAGCCVSGLDWGWVPCVRSRLVGLTERHRKEGV